jgi:hypothetical protein
MRDREEVVGAVETDPRTASKEEVEAASAQRERQQASPVCVMTEGTSREEEMCVMRGQQGRQEAGEGCAVLCRLRLRQAAI